MADSDEIKRWKDRCPGGLSDSNSGSDRAYMVTDGLIYVNDADECARAAARYEALAAWFKARPG